jgi:hypothetical protein
MAALPVHICARTGGTDLAAPESAGAGGDTFPAGPNSYLRVKNANAAPCVVTVTPPAAGGRYGTTVAPFALDPPVAATTGERIYGPFPADTYADANGLVNVSYSVTATVSVQALLMGG